jgi:hypothetical protein
LKNKFAIFGGAPDTIEADWINDMSVSKRKRMENIHLRQKARDVFAFRYKETIDSDKIRWELCSRVLPRRDPEEQVSERW